MKVLVCVASRHSATAEIAERIFSVLDRTLGAGAGPAGRAGDGTGAAEGVTVDLRAPDEVAGLDGYDAVVLGSAVYMGRWLPEARDFASRHSAALADRRVWLFSSGPIGRPPKPLEDPVDPAGIAAATHAREHRLFTGRLDRRRLALRERVVVGAFRTPDGDFRDWAAIESWAAGIAAELRAAAAARP